MPPAIIPFIPLIVGAAEVGVAAYGAHEQGKAADDAQRQAAAQEAARLEEQKREFDAQAEEAKRRADEAAARKAALIARLSPYVHMGEEAGANLYSLMGLPGSPSFGPKPLTSALGGVPRGTSDTGAVPTPGPGPTPAPGPAPTAAPPVPRQGTVPAGGMSLSTLGSLPGQGADQGQDEQPTVKMVAPDGTTTGTVRPSQVARALAMGHQRVV